MVLLEAVATNARLAIAPFAFGLAVVASIGLLNAVYKAFYGPLSHLPGTFVSRWTDLPVRLRILRGTRAQYVHRLHAKYGPILRTGPNEADVSDLGAIREVHRVRALFVKSNFYETGSPFQSIFTTRDPRFHTTRRRLFGQYFTESGLTRWEPTIANLASRAVQGLVEESKRHGHVDILKWWTLMAMDVIAEMSFGESFGMVEKGEKDQFAEDVARAGSVLPLRSAFPSLIALGPYVPFLSFFKDIAESRRRIFAVQQSRIARFFELVEADDSERSKSLFGALVKGDAGLSPMDLLVEVQSFITAGTDTTAVALTYLIWAVCRDDQIRARLLAELEGLPATPTHADVRDLAYLGCVIDEALRCYGAAPGALPRDVPPEGATLAGYVMPGGTVISTQAYSIHRDPHVFPEPDRFAPERWEHATKDMRSCAMPFGIGPRGCIGVHLARMELRLATAIFFQAAPNARMSTRDGMSDADMDPEISFLLMPKGHRCLMEIVHG